MVSRVENPELYMSSSHVGSMGGIMAIRRGEAHAAGCHLLDTNDGTYNRSFIRKYFPKGGVRLISCVGRQQGLMVAKGNPLNIQKFADIAGKGVRYVNRQKGSGTRILTDYLCKQENLDTAAIYGYDAVLKGKKPVAALAELWAFMRQNRPEGARFLRASPHWDAAPIAFSLCLDGVPRFTPGQALAACSAQVLPACAALRREGSRILYLLHLGDDAVLEPRLRRTPPERR